MTFWPNRRVLVTGGSGFLASVIVRQLHALNAAAVFVPRSHEYDLRQLEKVQQALRDGQLVSAAGPGLSCEARLDIRLYRERPGARRPRRAAQKFWDDLASMLQTDR